MTEIASAFQEAWHPEETPHLIQTTAFTEAGLGLPARNSSFGEQKDRSRQYHERMLGFDADAIPVEGTALVIGSGLTRRFERELHNSRPDIFTVSIDPLLRYGVRERLREAIRTQAYQASTGNRAYDVSFPRELVKSEPFYRSGAVAGAVALKGSVFQGLPCKDASFNAVIALHSLPEFSAPAEVPLLLQEMLRVMKPEATAWSYPFPAQYLHTLHDRAFTERATELRIGPNGSRADPPNTLPGQGPRRVVFQRKGI